MRIGVYAAAKNEEKHALDWYVSCQAADVIVVADTGSTDNTRYKLESTFRVDVTSIRILPWRFDDAFNFAMALLPSDIDVCIRLDLDERLQTGWREALEKAWVPGTDQLRYEYVWNWIDGKPGLQWLGDRIHSRVGFRWRGATHEGLEYRLGVSKQITCLDVKIWQFSDPKVKNDLTLLGEAEREAPTDSRVKLYLARELMTQGFGERAAAKYKEYLKLIEADRSLIPERLLAYRNLAKLEPTYADYWLAHAMAKNDTFREPYVDLARLFYAQENWKRSLYYAEMALEIKERPLDYTCDPEACGPLPHDLAASCAWALADAAEETAEKLELYEKARGHLLQAIKLSPTDPKLLNNLHFVEEKLDAAQKRAYESKISCSKCDGRGYLDSYNGTIHCSACNPPVEHER